MTYLPEALTEYSKDFSNELPIESFLQYGFYKIADAGLKPEERFIKNPEVNPIQYNVVKGLEDKYNSYRELIYAIVIDGRIVKIGMKVQGSALATASASLLFSELKELTLEEAQHIHQGIFKTLLDGEINELPGDLCVYQSIVHLPERHDCALLAWKALGEALAF